MRPANKPRVFSSGQCIQHKLRSHRERSISAVGNTSRSNVISKRDVFNSTATASPYVKVPLEPRDRRSQVQLKKNMSSSESSQDTNTRVPSVTKTPSLTSRKAQQKNNQPPLTKSAQYRHPLTRSRPTSSAAKLRANTNSRTKLDQSTSNLISNSSNVLRPKPSDPKHWFELPNPILPKLPPKGACLSTIIETSHYNLKSLTSINSLPVTALITSISTIWRKKQLYDVVLAIGPHRLGAHKIILAASSDYFYELFTREEDNQDGDDQFMYTLKGINFETMRMVLESMYTCRLLVNSENVEKILNAATYLKIPAALDSCSDFLIRNLNMNSCLVTIALAQVFELINVADKACKLAAKHFLEIAEMDEFLELTESMMLMLIRRDDLEVKSELQVFEALLRWIDVDREERLVHADHLLETIRLPLIRPADLIDHVESIDYLMDIPECETLLKEALHYHCLPKRQSVMQSCRTTPRSSIKTTTLIALGGHPRHAKDPVSSRMDYYNPIEKKWKILAHMKQPRHHHAVACLGGFVYVAGGRETSQTNMHPLRTVYRYDPRTDEWIRVADMINARESFQLAVLDEKVYAVGGRVDDQMSLADAERYNSSTDKWEEIAPLSDARRGVAIAVNDGKLYAIGGSGNRKISCKVERYNPHTDTWEMRRQLTTPRFFALLSSIDQHLFLSGGATLDSTTGDVHCVPNIERYNPRTDTWMVLTPMAEPRAEAASCVLGRRIYVVGGYSWDSNSYLQSVECYDTDEDVWSTIEMFPRAYTGIACCALTLYNIP